MKKTLPYLIIAAAIGTFLISTSCTGDEAVLSRKAVLSEIARNPEPECLDFGKGVKWDYTVGLELKAFLEVYERYGGQEIFDYAESWYDSMIDSTGAILANYRKNNYSTDHVCPGKTLFILYDKTGKEKYRAAMDTLRSQLSSHPRTSEGGFWHKKIYPHQMWLDGLYMAQPFYAEYTARYDSGNTEAFKDIVNHFLVCAHHTYDSATGLYRHAWDESRSMFWCDPETGQSAHAWGRALGWYCMAVVDALEFVPEGTEGRDELVDIFKGIIARLPEYADPETGMWYQVLDRPGHEGNYVEATCSAMFVYSMLKGIRTGLLDRSLKPYAEGCYDKLVSTFVTEDDGLVNLHRCCSVAGLGGKQMRSGTFDYYVGEKIVDNDPKGVGPLIYASLEME